MNVPATYVLLLGVHIVRMLDCFVKQAYTTDMITKTHLVAIGATTAVIAGLVGGFIWLGLKSETQTSPVPMATLTVAAPTPSTSAVSSNPSANTAVIQGQKIFPSQAIPHDFTVCAVNVANQAEICGLPSSEPTYRLELPAGSYQVYAAVPSFDPSYRAYYSRFITCGLQVECTDHTPITVTVAAGQTSAGLDVGDFYR